MKAYKMLVVTDQVAVSLSTVMESIKTLKKEVVENIDPLIITQASLDSVASVEFSTVDDVISISKSSEFPNDQLLVSISKILKSGGSILLCVSYQSDSGKLIISLERTSLERKLLVAGFLDIKSYESNQSLVIVAKKPSWKIGSSFSIKKPLKVLPKVQIDDDDDLIDEDSLLTEEDLKKPKLPSVDDCEVGSTRKACKNCSCGRAEAEEKVPKLGLTMDQLSNPQSACGNCGLGDAFRCGTCPYKGLPTFKLGEKVTLAGNFLTSDI